MRAAIAQTASIAILVFAVSSMLSVGLAYRIGRIVAPLREARSVFRALVANFVLVPLLAVAIERVIPMDPPVALGLLLVAGSAGAPFLIKLATAARSDLALSAGLLLLLVPMTVVFLPMALLWSDHGAVHGHVDGRFAERSRRSPCPGLGDRRAEVRLSPASFGISPAGWRSARC